MSARNPAELEDAVIRLTERAQYLEDQLSFYKYRYKLLKISSANKSQNDDPVKLNIAWGKRVKQLHVPKTTKIISLKRLIFDEYKIIISDIELSWEGNDLSNEFTISDYMISDNATIHMETRYPVINLDGSVFSLSGLATVRELLSKVGSNQYLALQSKIIPEDTEVSSLDLDGSYLTKRHKVVITHGDSFIGEYGINSVADLEALKIPVWMPDIVEETLSGQDSQVLRLQLARWEVVLENSKHKEFIIDTLALTAAQLKKMLAFNKDEEIEIWDGSSSAYRAMSDDSFLYDFFDPYNGVLIKVRAVTYITILHNKTAIKLTRCASATSEDLEAQTKGYYLTHKETNLVKPSVSWNHLSNFRLSSYKISIYSFDDVLLYEVGVDEVDRDTIITSLFYKLDNLMFDAFVNILRFEIGDVAYYLNRASQPNISELIELMNRANSTTMEILIERKLTITKMSSPNKSLVFGFNAETSIGMVKEYIVGNSNAPHVFRLLSCKKSISTKGFVNLQRYSDYELLINCGIDRFSDTIYYELAAGDQNPLPKELYVVEYNKDKTNGGVNGIVKRFKTEALIEM